MNGNRELEFYSRVFTFKPASYAIETCDLPNQRFRAVFYIQTRLFLYLHFSHYVISQETLSKLLWWPI